MEPDRTTPFETRRRRHGPAIAAAALAAALAVALPLWFVFRGEESAPVVTGPTVVTTTMLGSTTTVPAGTTTTTTAESATITTMPTTTRIPWGEAPPRLSLVAVSADEAWASWAYGVAPVQIGGVARFVDGAWMTLFSVYPRFSEGAWVAVDPDLPYPVSELAVAPDGTVWVSGDGGVFSFDGVEWTRRFDHPAGGVTVAPDGTVWIGGGGWLARWDDGSWVPVGPDPQEPPDITGYAADQSALPLPGVATSDGEVWMVETLGDPCGWAVAAPLLHYDGTMWLVEYDGTTLRDGRGLLSESHGLLGGSCDLAAGVDAAPNGDIWALMRVGDRDSAQWVLGRFDGEGWITYTPPFAETGYRPAMAVGPDGLVWFALEDGLLAFDGTDWTYHIQRQGVSSVDVAPDGTVWYIDQDGAHTLGN